MRAYSHFSITCLVAVCSLSAVGESKGAASAAPQQAQATAQQPDPEVKKSAYHKRQEARLRLQEAIAARKAADPKWKIPERAGKGVTK